MKACERRAPNKCTTMAKKLKLGCSVHQGLYRIRVIRYADYGSFACSANANACLRLGFMPTPPLW